MYRFPWYLTLVSSNRASSNPGQVVNEHASHVCSQHLFGLPLRMNGMHITNFDLITRVLTICHVKRKQAQCSSKSVLNFILSGSPNECWLDTCDACVMKTWRLGLRAPIVKFAVGPSDLLYTLVCL